MILIDQDRTSIINFDNVTSLHIVNVERDTHIRVQTNNGDHKYLGKYKTEERAMEILQEIIKFHDVTKIKMMLQSTAMLNLKGNDFAYGMPEK